MDARDQPAEANFIVIAEGIKLVGDEAAAIDPCAIGAANVHNLDPLVGMLDDGVQGRDTVFIGLIQVEINVRLAEAISISAAYNIAAIQLQKNLIVSFGQQQSDGSDPVLGRRFAGLVYTFNQRQVLAAVFAEHITFTVGIAAGRANFHTEPRITPEQRCFFYYMTGTRDLVSGVLNASQSHDFTAIL
jgi:hypothetical protein